MKDLPKIANDDGKKEIEITFTRFICIGASQPHDHPHVALEIGKNKQISCPYCGTLFKLVDPVDYLDNLRE
ncbi:MAG: zinc-finger domain-containing protein [Pseudomonadota bacterium]|jgi:uncharacterized Zn-finger protein|nr:hypothetical protein [Rhodobiaceae bacterium]MDP6878524.1 zinc-finger domain-containing protein [Candidatus Neomarinimicrobiota bacterium]MEC9075143.1 zinc-finger domain-containing protein [Pseudomonadota bacterium]MEC9098240.1 zinc-finger domain-containing protein [Pseudomonadota bacterium]MED5254289.1 zinc-finger domain-containing protein [Pseudomonadota bacterium]|tara:strand:- start:204 stop:416 length:213 start_codon:yes stop_codon:yes gene_type:complete